MVAELLDLPCVTTVAHLEIDGARGTAEREVEGGVEVVEFTLPAVLTTDKGLNEPRYPALKGIMAAKKKPLDTKLTTVGQGGLEILALMPPPERKRSEEHTSELQSPCNLVCRLLLEKKKQLHLNVMQPAAAER